MTEPTELAPNFALLSGGVEARIRAHLPQLKGAAQRAAERILKDLEQIANRSIAETALAAGTSTSSVTRFCRAIGLAGYPELRLEVAALVGRKRSEDAGWRKSLGADIGPDDTIEDVLSTLVATDIKVTTQTAEQLSLSAVDELVAKILAAKRIDIYATGGSALVADEFMHKVQLLGIFIQVWRDVHSAIISASLLGANDLAIGISHSGVTVDVIESMTAAAEGGAPTVAITSFPGSPLGTLADLLLTTTAGDLTYYVAAYPARNAQLLVLDLVFLRLAQQRHEQAAETLELTAKAVKNHNARRADSKQHSRFQAPDEK